jgi:hypothetical protein
LSNDQQNLFKTYRPAEDPRKVWDELQNLSKQVEFAAGTRALEQACGLSKCVDSLKDIHGDLGESSPSADQFNVEVNWTQAALSLEQLPGWSDHIAVLHENQFGYEENRDGNPFLGLVVLFDEKHPPDKIHGQFHIGFRSWFAHYNRVNGNIDDYFNYECYCQWYGQFDAFKPASGASPLALASLDTNPTAGAAKSDLIDSVEDFLEAWYVRRNYSQFRSYIAQENAYEAEAKANKPRVSQDLLIAGLFHDAFIPVPQQQPQITGRLSDFIYSPLVSALGQEIRPTLDRREQGNRLFSVFTVDQFPPGGVVPRTRPRDDAALFLFRLRQKYELRVVIYVTEPDRGVLQETAVMYWIRQRDGAWKLAAYEGTDW